MTDQKASSTDHGRASTIYTRGRVLALDGRSAAEEALLVRDGRVAVVGSAEQVRARADANTRTVDLAGASVMSEGGLARASG